MLNEGLKITGRIQIFEEGKLVLEEDNLVVNGGLAFLADRMKDDSVSYMDYIAVGDNSTTVVASDSALYSELDRNQATNKTAGATTFEIETLFNPSEAVGTWREAAIFNGSVAGVMFNRVNINYTKGATNTTIKFTITFANS